MSEIQPYNSLLPTVRNSRALSRISNNTTVATAAIQAKAELECTKVEAITAVAAKAMLSVSQISALENALVQANPNASGRVNLIADLTAMALADVVTTAARRIGH